MPDEMTLQESIEYLSDLALKADETQAELYGQVILHLKSLEKYKKNWQHIKSDLTGAKDPLNLSVPKWLLEEMGVKEEDK